MTDWLSNHAGLSAFVIVFVIPVVVAKLIDYAMNRAARRDDDRDEHAKYPGI